MRSSNCNFSELPEFDRHEMVVFFSDPLVDLQGFIAIHNTHLGPATGGTRMMSYASHEAAVKDALLLSKAMSYKCALAGVKFGGSKAVIIGNPKKKTTAMMRSYGKIINRFGGNVRTGCDVGITNDDVSQMAKVTKYVAGYNAGNNKRLLTGDMAALGVFFSIKACLEQSRGSSSLRGARVAIKGVGKLGGELARLLACEGAELVVADVDVDLINRLRKNIPSLKWVSPGVIHKQEVDVYAPCALGSEFTDTIVRQLKTKIVVGGANNQLSHPRVADHMYEQGILYAPDYIVNAGGLINVADEDEKGGYNEARVLKRVKNIGRTLSEIIQRSNTKSLPPYKIADQIAEGIIYKKD